MVNSPLIRPAIYWGGGSFGRGTLDSHDTWQDYGCGSGVLGLVALRRCRDEWRWGVVGRGQYQLRAPKWVTILLDNILFILFDVYKYIFIFIYASTICVWYYRIWYYVYLFVNVTVVYTYPYYCTHMYTWYYICILFLSHILSHIKLL